MTIQSPTHAKIVLCTVNARYAHAALGIRWIKANLKHWQADTALCEFTLEELPTNIVETLLSYRPTIVGFSVYIWNVALLCSVVAILKRVAPSVTIVLGGPEVSFDYLQPSLSGLESPITRHADFVIAGAGELSFFTLCQSILSPVATTAQDLPHKKHKWINPPADPLSLLDKIEFPYDLYTDKDLAHRIIYLEASRGCPFKCEFCLSSLDKTAKPFPQDKFLAALEKLWQRGLRQFKFVDRTFNIHPKVSLAILDFFLSKSRRAINGEGDRDTLNGEERHAPTPYFVHFEMIPDHLPESIKERLMRFPHGTLQLEIGIQTWDETVQKHISRRQDNDKSEENLRWLMTHTTAHLHTDLIIGLPDEDIDSLAKGFNRLWHMGVHEIQVGVLKKLKGAPIARHIDAHGLVFNPDPPYTILSTRVINFEDMQRLTRFARFWDMLGNSGRFGQSLPLILKAKPIIPMGPQDSEASPFHNFLALSDWIYRRTEKTHGFALERLHELIFEAAPQLFNIDPSELKVYLFKDYINSGARGAPQFLSELLQEKQQQERQRKRAQETKAKQSRDAHADNHVPPRQKRHLHSEDNEDSAV